MFKDQKIVPVFKLSELSVWFSLQLSGFGGGGSLYCICVKLQNISGLDLMLYSYVFPNFLFITLCIIARQYSLPITGTTDKHKQQLSTQRHSFPVAHATVPLLKNAPTAYSQL